MFPRPGLLRQLPALALIGVTGSAAVAVILRSPERREPPTAVLGSHLVEGDDNGAPFLVSGDVTGLAPGVTRPLRLRLSNPSRNGIAVRTLHVAVADSSTGCSGRHLRVGPFTGPAYVPGGGEAEVTLPVTMAAAAPDLCQGGTFPLTYGGSAVQA